MFLGSKHHLQHVSAIVPHEVCFFGRREFPQSVVQIVRLMAPKSAAEISGRLPLREESCLGDSYTAVMPSGGLAFY